MALFTNASMAAILLALASKQGSSDEAEPAQEGNGTPVFATYRGQKVDVSDTWHGAAVLHLTSNSATLFDTEVDLDLFLDSQKDAIRETAKAAGSNCGSSLRLYDGTSYSGSMISLTERGTWINLSSEGFNQKTSSFKIGACRAKFADWNNGGGATYPLSLTEAWDQSPSMASGWNNDVSSVYIY